ncbi:MAG: hypothetical protein NTW40_01125 [Acidobacteria bacterium]|nr:hypothetical protein [Acidobacteriota bacterium]
MMSTLPLFPLPRTAPGRVLRSLVTASRTALALLALFLGQAVSAQTMIQRTGMMKTLAATYPSIPGYAAPVYGTGGAGTYPPTGWTGIQNASVDDNFLTIALPFTFYMAGTGYTTTYLGSNSYITFGAGASVYSSLSASNPPNPKLMFGSADNSYQRVSTLSSTTSLKIRYEGNGSTSGTAGSPGIVVELTLFKPSLFYGSLNVIEMRVGVHNQLTGLSMIANASSSLLSYTLAQNQSYVFIGDATGSTWKVVSGAHMDLTALKPTLTTTAVSAITATTATSGGTITSPGGTTITASGVCWSTSANPTIADSKTTGATASGSFTGALTGLLGGLTYYVRAYATNTGGTAYGDQVSFTTTSGVYGNNWLRGAPTTDPTNRRAVVTSMAGINSSVPYRTDLEAWTGNWQAPQAIYEHGSNLDDPTTWYQTSANEGSTWSNPTLGTSAGELVVDMQTTRTLARFVVFQMFSDGKTTHAYFYSHPSTSATAPANTDAGWVLVGGGTIGAGATSGSVVTSPTTFTVTPFTSRYIKLRAQNDGTQLSPSYIELKGVKAFSQ